MELGERLLEARKEAGLSQRQVCGDVITRNMLSRIEHGTVQPSMKTLQYLAQVLGKPVGYFLGETTASANEGIMAQARECFADGKYAQVLQTLEAYQEPDPLDWERGLLGFLSCLLAAEAAAAQGRGPVEEKYLTLSEGFSSPYLIPALLSYREKLRGGLGALPSLDAELLLRARSALEAGNLDRARKLLEAVENQGSLWQGLYGSLCMASGNHAEAVEHLLKGDPLDCLPLLEECYRAQGDYEKAYLCACRRREYEK